MMFFIFEGVLFVVIIGLGVVFLIYVMVEVMLRVVELLKFLF